MKITREIVDDIYSHMEWADARVWRAVRGREGAADDAKLYALLQHLHVVQRAFLLMWTGGEVKPDELYAKRDPGDLMRWAREYHRDADAFFSETDELRYAELLNMPWIAQYEKQLGQTLQQPTLGETLYQVPAHSTYHRGQVNLRLREVGGEPPLVDYIAWVWFGRPEPEWPA